MSSVCLSIIFNHKYNNNIPVLNRIYNHRFSSVYYIVPFFNENIDEVPSSRIIPVYETSYCFQGYITQAFQKIKKDEYSHYIFIADDQILNPLLNENNIIEQMGLDKLDSYIKEIVPYDELRNGSLVDKSNKLYNILSAFNMNVGVAYQSEIPPYDDAATRCAHHNLRVAKSLPLSFFLNKGYLGFKYLPLTMVTLGVNRGTKLKYPLFKAYSDFLIIDRASMKEFSRLSGVFAAMNIFVETAIPLAMVLACKTIKYEKDLKKFHGIEYWGKDILAFEKKYKSNLDLLFHNFGDDILYYHPVKLSRWTWKKTI